MSNTGERVRFPSANPAGEGVGVIYGKPAEIALIVVHEWWGMNDQIQEKGAQLAQETGFTILVPDLYRGKLGVNHEEAGHLMHGLDWPGALQDITAAAQLLLKRGSKKVGITGFCMGGALSFAAAVKCPEILASAPFYGLPNPDLADLTTIKIPVQAHFGKFDHVKGFSSAEDYIPVRDKLLNAGVNLEFFEYEAGHAFANSKSESYDKTAAELAMSRMIKFMRTNLGSKAGNL